MQKLFIDITLKAEQEEVILLFVLKNLLENAQLLRGDEILTAAFGPGLNIETALLEYV